MIHSTTLGYGSTTHMGNFGATKSAAVAQLQRAVNLLALNAKDPSLQIAVDGITGPGTAKATNLAMTQYVKTGSANLRTGKLTPAQVAQNAIQLATIIGEAAKAIPADSKAPGTAPPAAATATREQIRALQAAMKALGTKTGDPVLTAMGVDGLLGPQTRGGAARVVTRYNVPSPTGGPPTIPQLRQASVTKKFTAAIKEKTASVTKPVAPAKTAPTRSPTVKRLQNALVALGKAVGDRILVRTGVDGIAGPQTAAAVTRAMQNYVPGDFKVQGVGSVPPELRAPMTPTAVTANAEMLSRILEAAIAVQGKQPPAAPAEAPDGRTKRSRLVTQIQQLLSQLAEMKNDPGLRVVVDGILGRGTTAAVNKALGTRMSVAQVANSMDSVIARLKSEVAAVGAPPAEEPEQAPPPDPDPQAEAEEEAAAQDAGQPKDAVGPTVDQAQTMAAVNEMRQLLGLEPSPQPIDQDLLDALNKTLPPSSSRGPWVAADVAVGAQRLLNAVRQITAQPEMPAAQPEMPGADEGFEPIPEPEQATIPAEETEYIPPPPEPPPVPGPSLPDFPMPAPPTPQQTMPREPVYPDDPDAPIEPTLVPTPSQEVAPIPDMPPPAPAKKGVPTWVWIAGGAAALVGVGGAVYLMVKRKKGGGAAEPAMADYMYY